MADSTDKPGRRERYGALIKPGDAVETPDGQLWVVERIAGARLMLASAYRDRSDRICVDVYDATRTAVPADLATKVADAREVRR